MTIPKQLQSMYLDTVGAFFSSRITRDEFFCAGGEVERLAQSSGHKKGNDYASFVPAKTKKGE